MLNLTECCLGLSDQAGKSASRATQAFSGFGASMHHTLVLSFSMCVGVSLSYLVSVSASRMLAPHMLVVCMRMHTPHIRE